MPLIIVSSLTKHAPVPHTPQDQARPGGIDNVIGHMTSSAPPSYTSHSGHHFDVTVGCVFFFCALSAHILLRVQRCSPPSDGAGLNGTWFRWFLGNNIVSLTKHAPMPHAPQDQVRPGGYQQCVIRCTTSGTPPPHALYSGHCVDVAIGQK